MSRVCITDVAPCGECKLCTPQPLFPSLAKADELAAGRITDQATPCDHCGLWRPVWSDAAVTPGEALKVAVEAATAALDRAKAEGFVIPPQAAQGVALLDMTARMLLVQPAEATRPGASRDHTVTGDPVT